MLTPHTAEVQLPSLVALHKHCPVETAILESAWHAPIDCSRFRLAGAAFAAFSFLPAELGRLAGALVGVAFRLAGDNPLQAARAATCWAWLCGIPKGRRSPCEAHDHPAGSSMC